MKENKKKNFNWLASNNRFGNLSYGSGLNLYILDTGTIIDLEDFYKRGLFVSKRTTEAGAKKKYALISEDNQMKIRGFETVRRDWCKLSRNLQSEVLGKILKDGDEKSALKTTNFIQKLFTKLD